MDVLGGLRLLGGVAGVPPELRNQAKASLHASKREVDFWVPTEELQVEVIVCSSLGQVNPSGGFVEAQ